MLSFFISNVLICSNAVFGLTPTTLENDVSMSNYLNQERQTLLVSSQAPQDASRDSFIVVEAPALQTASLRSQIATQSLPASNSSLVNSAMKYLGAYWDCTAVVEQALRDLGYSVGELGPMDFGQFGTVFYDQSQVQPGDIMMRPGHVAIWAGDGMSVQGGYGFGGVVYNSWEGPANYTTFVRIG